jgi:hypothetical protein
VILNESQLMPTIEGFRTTCNRKIQPSDTLVLPQHHDTTIPTNLRCLALKNAGDDEYRLQLYNYL